MQSCLSEEAVDEISALSAIMGPDCWSDASTPGKLILCVAPEVDDTEVVACVAISVTLPIGYPQDAHAVIEASSVTLHASLFPHRHISAAGSLSAEQVAVLKDAIAEIIEARTGEAVVYDVVDAVRQWLATNTLSSRPEMLADVSDMLAHADVSEDDLELDEEDVDEEMAEAMKEVLEGDAAMLKRIQKAEKHPAASKEYKERLMAVFKSMTTAQRREMVADSSGSSDEDGDDEDDRQPVSRAGASCNASAGRKAQKADPMPPAAQRSCTRGHNLTAVNAKPDDYRKLDGGEGNCDVCGADFYYTQGGYHCGTCRNWDCCVKCGGKPPAGGAGGASNGKRGKKK